MEVILDAISIKEQKQTAKGKVYTPVGIRIGTDWHNAMFWGSDSPELAIVKEWKPGIKVNITLYQEDYQGKPQNKWRFPTDQDRLEERVTRLEKAMTTLWNERKAAQQ